MRVVLETARIGAEKERDQNTQSNKPKERIVEFAFKSYFGRIETLHFNNARQAQMYAQQTGLEYLGHAYAVIG